MNERRLVCAICALLLVCILWVRLHRRDSRIDTTINSIVLPPQDAEKLIINEHTHSIIDITRRINGTTQTKKSFLGPNTSVEIFAHGGTKVTTRSWGTEVSPSIGVLYGSDTTLRAAGSLGLLYRQRFEFGIGLGMASHINEARALVDLQYNAYDNIMAGLFIDNHKSVGVIATLKF